MPRTTPIDPGLKAKYERDVHRVIHTEMAKQDISYRVLTKRLNEMGVECNYENVKTKIAMGKMSANYFLFILIALNVKTVHLDYLRAV
jgi:hypothetical protein